MTHSDMRILLINMETATDRYEFQKRQFEKLGLQFERFNAVTKETLPAHIPEAYWGQWERPLQLAERSCLLSHRNAWEIVADENTPILILEDDAILTEHLPKILQAAQHLKNIDHLTLEVFGREKLVSKTTTHLTGPINIHRLYQDKAGAAAYILWPTGAQKLLESTKNQTGIADAVINQNYKLLSFQAIPACAIQPDRCDHFGLPSPITPKSIINKDINRAKTIPSTRRHKMNRIRAKIRLGLRRLSKLFTAEKISVPIHGSDFPEIKALLKP